MLIKVKLAVPKVDDPRLGAAGMKKDDVHVWVNPDEIVTMQASPRPGIFAMLLRNGLTMPCEGDVDRLAADINMVARSGVMPQIKV